MTLNLVTVVCLIFTTFMVAKASDYEPIAAWKVVRLTFPDNQPQFVDLTVNDSLIETFHSVFIFTAFSSMRPPVILFSHGLGSREGSGYLGRHFTNKTTRAARGYVVVFRGLAILEVTQSYGRTKLP